MTQNPQITRLLRFVTWIESGVVFISGVGLFFFPDAMGTLWPWLIAPFNMRFMGAIYLTSWVAAGLLTWHGRWSPTRIVVPMILAFTSIVLVVSVLYIGRFDSTRFSVGGWFFLYIAIPLNSLYHVWLYRNLPPADSTPLPSRWRMILLAQTGILGLYGVALLIAPAFFSGFWAWGIDEFHGRMYSVAFITPAVGSLMMLRGATRLEWFTQGMTQSVLGLFAIMGVVIVDMAVKRVNWSLAGTWLWMAIFASILAVGLGMVWQSRQAQNTR